MADASRKTRPVFLVSLPRAGSTWLQSLIAGSPDVATSAENWVMLPLIEGVYRGLGFTRYNQGTYRLAKEAAAATDEKFNEALRKAVREFALHYYETAGDGARWFLDKTPRYSLICNDLHRLLPEARFVVLFRNPVDVARSLATTFGGRWNTLFRYEIDFAVGLPTICTLARERQDNVLVVRYEDALADSAATCARIGEFLQIEIDAKNLALGREKSAGTLGDPNVKHENVKRDLTHGEKRQVKRFLCGISDADLATMDYSRAALEQQLAGLPAVRSLRDLGSAAAKPLYTSGWAYPFEKLSRRLGDNRRQPFERNPPGFGLE